MGTILFVISGTIFWVRISPQTRKFVLFIRKSQIRKFQQNSAQLCLNKVLKLVFLHYFLLCVQILKMAYVQYL